jgi:hypothetical protein
MLIGGQGQSQTPHAVADVHTYRARTMQPFAAEPITSDLPEPVIAPRPTVAVSNGGGAASAPVVRLPRQLHVEASAIPRAVLAAYVNGAKMTNRVEPQCQVRWQVLAGIGYIESDNARSGGSSNPRWNGIANPPIYGPVLDGQGGVGRVPDSDRAALDGLANWDRAVGPMQFLPSTWGVFGVDADGDGVANPQDINDAALAAAHYLCAASPELSRPRNLIRAVHAYNHSYAYVRAVLTAAASYLDINPKALGINGLPKPHRMRVALDVAIPPPPPSSPHRPAATRSHAPAKPTTPTISLPRPTVTDLPAPASTSSPASPPAPTLPVRTPIQPPTADPAPTSPDPVPTSPSPAPTLPPP